MINFIVFIYSKPIDFYKTLSWGILFRYLSLPNSFSIDFYECQRFIMMSSIKNYLSIFVGILSCLIAMDSTSRTISDSHLHGGQLHPHYRNIFLYFNMKDRNRFFLPVCLHVNV